MDLPVVVAVGSNAGSPAAHVADALRRLRDRWPTQFLSSSLWETTPVECPPDSPPFINAAVCFLANQGDTPLNVLATLKTWEREAGRAPKTVLNEPRPLDLDLIAFQDARCTSTHLTLPHPRAHLRRFVLAPLAEIAPDLILPGWTSTVADRLRSLSSDERVVQLVSTPRRPTTHGPHPTPDRPHSRQTCDPRLTGES